LCVFPFKFAFYLNSSTLAKFLMKPEKQLKYDKAYLKMALEWSQLSYCDRRQVGALIVKDKMIISDGYNGTPSGFENICEDDEGYTKWYVLHAEANAILKVAASTQSCVGATLYITMSPCKECSKLIHQSGIRRVVYVEAYKDHSGIQFLQKAGVEVEHIPTLQTS
jgi:dCMP deaminase